MKLILSYELHILCHHYLMRLFSKTESDRVKGIVYFLVLVLFPEVACRPEPFMIDKSKILETYDLTINQASGLCFPSDTSSFFIVSDQGMLYQISMTGSLIKEFPITGNDFEGVTFDPLSSCIYLCEERSGMLLKIDLNGNELESYAIMDQPGNNGIEGLTFNRNLNEFYLLKEKNEGLLIKYSIESNIKKEVVLNFANDYSGLFYNEMTDKLWIVSHESKTITQCDLEGNKIKTMSLPISGMEGIAVNKDETEAYVVSDPNKKLYQINLRDYVNPNWEYS